MRCSRSRSPWLLMRTYALPSSRCQPSMPARSDVPVTASGVQKWGYEKPATRSAASPRPAATRRAPAMTAAFLIQLELVLIVLLERGVLHFLAQEAVADGERLDLGAHEAAERVLRAADDRLAAHVEAGVDDHRTAGLLLELAEQLVETRVGFLVHGLHARRVIDVRHRRNRRARNVELLDAEELLLLFGHGDAVLVADIGDQQHVGALAVDAEVLRRVFRQHRGREWTEGLAVLHLQVELLLHAGRARITEDRAGAECARAELHASLEPPERLALGERLGARGDHLLFVEHFEHRAGAARAPRVLFVGVLGPEIAATHAVRGAVGRFGNWGGAFPMRVVGARRGAGRTAGVARRG